jgi:hypothetical protein
MKIASATRLAKHHGPRKPVLLPNVEGHNAVPQELSFNSGGVSEPSRNSPFMICGFGPASYNPGQVVG